MIICLGLVYFIAVNFYGIYIMKKDKALSQTDKMRVPEAKIFLIACIGGSFGVFLGMQTFRHKTKHGIFVIGVPSIMLVQALQVALYVLVV